MSKKYQYFKGNKDKEFNISEMRKYVKTNQEIDKILERIISPVIKEKKLKILDACYGIGHITNLLSTIKSKKTNKITLSGCIIEKLGNSWIIYAENSKKI